MNGGPLGEMSSLASQLDKQITNIIRVLDIYLHLHTV